MSNLSAPEAGPPDPELATKQSTGDDRAPTPSRRDRRNQASELDPVAPAWPAPAAPDGTPSGFELTRDHFVAGYADRFVFSRSYVPLLCSYWTPTIADSSKLLRLMTSVGAAGREAAQRVLDFGKNAAQLGKQLEQRVQSGVDIKWRDIRRVLEAAWTASTPRKPRAVAPQVGFQPSIGGFVYVSAAPPPADAAALDVAASADLQAVVKESGPLGLGNLKAGVVQGAAQYINLGWLGILFYDRLRLRPAGLVAGDQVYSLSLAPGEEVALTQSSETKRSKSFEEVLDRTTEQELEFNSTWSTSISQQDANTETKTLTGNLGLSVGVKIDDVNVGVNGGVSASDSNAISQTLQQAKTLQVTTRASTKAREEHKTTFRISTDVTEEFGSKRVLRTPIRRMDLR